MAKRSARAKRAAKRTAKAPQKLSVRWAVVYVGLLAGIGWSGLHVVAAATETRALYKSLGEIQRAQDRLLEESSRLSLERGSISSLQKIEQVAMQDLDMLFPESVQRVAP